MHVQQNLKFRCNSVVMFRVDGTCDQWLSGVRHFLLCFLTFLLAGPPLMWDPSQIFSTESEAALGGRGNPLELQYSIRTSQNSVRLCLIIFMSREMKLKVK